MEIKHDVAHHIEMKGPPVCARPWPLAPELLKINCQEFKHDGVRNCLTNIKQLGFSSAHRTQDDTRWLASMWRFPHAEQCHNPWPVPHPTHPGLYNYFAWSNHFFQIGSGPCISSNSRWAIICTQNSNHNPLWLIQISLDAIWSTVCSSKLPKIYGSGAVWVTFHIQLHPQQNKQPCASCTSLRTESVQACALPRNALLCTSLIYTCTQLAHRQCTIRAQYLWYAE